MNIALKSIIRNGLYLLILVMFAGMAACNSAKQVAYFQDVPDTTGVMMRMATTPYQDLIINKGDILYIEISTLDATIGSMNTESQGRSEETSIQGYMVDKNGDVELPIIGITHVEGMTMNQAKEAIRNKALKFFKDPIVNVRLGNFVITILGQVNRPGRYVVNSEKINIVDALGLAGDLDIAGKRSNVMVIREEAGEVVFSRVDLNSTDLFKSKFYYLQSGDKIYVEPLKVAARRGTADTRGERIVALGLSVVSIGVALVSLMVR